VQLCEYRELFGSGGHRFCSSGGPKFFTPRSPSVAVLVKNRISRLDPEKDWVIDSGATSHLTRSLPLLTNLENGRGRILITANKPTLIDKQGEAKIVAEVEGGKTNMLLRNVLYVSSVPVNLINISKIDLAGFHCTTENFPSMEFCQKGTRMVYATATQGLYILDRDRELDFVLSVVEDATLWHQRLDHINRERLDQMKGGKVEGISFPEGAGSPDCDACKLGKAKCSPIRNLIRDRAATPGMRLHTDTMGSILPSHGGNKYMTIVVDCNTKKVFLYFLKTKDQAAQHVLECVAFINNHFGESRVKEVHSDCGGEFMGEM
jgi:hypothetical protein